MGNSSGTLSSLVVPLKDLETFYMISIPIQTIVTIFAVFLSVNFIRTLWQIRKSQNEAQKKIRANKSAEVKASTLFRNTMILCAVFGILCLFADLSHMYYCAITNTYIYNRTINNIYSISDFFYYTSTNAFYVTAILRVKLTFHSSQYKITKHFYTFYCGILIITIITMIYYVIIVAIMPTVKFFYKYATVAIVILITNDFLLNSSLIGIFVQKLRHSVIDLEVQRYKERYIDKINKMGLNHCETLRLSLSETSDTMVNVVTIHTVLFGSAILTNVVFLVCLLIGSWVAQAHYYIFLFRAIECLCNIIVLYLSIKKNRSKYFTLCGLCHYGIKNCCVKNAKKNSKKKAKAMVIRSLRQTNDEMALSGLDLISIDTNERDVDVIQPSPSAGYVQLDENSVVTNQQR